MRHKRYDQLGCPVELCTEIIGGKWKGEILFILFTGKKRHSELRKLIPGTTQRMLTTQLRELEADGVIERKIYAQVPPKVEYSISERGQSLKPIIDAMWLWGKSFLDTLPKNQTKLPTTMDVKDGKVNLTFHTQNRETLRDKSNRGLSFRRKK
jgi:DNA-binding HxlR family transcriptional regulator